ncbi:MAG: hypothetical protein WD016_09525 [Balneolaceae bacterium]
MKINFRNRDSLAFNVHFLVFMLFFAVCFSSNAEAQNSSADEDIPSPRGAFLRSLAVPGWGHYYNDNNNWNRGKYHLASDAVLILSYFGLKTRANYLENDFYTFARSNAGANMEGKSREYEIAVGNYDNLKTYNDSQLQLRNWNQIYPETAEFNWNWKSRDLRTQYQDARERVDKNRGQLPTLVALMVVNRVVSGVSAFVQARNLWENAPEASFSYLNEYGEPGVMANLRFNF